MYDELLLSWLPAWDSHFSPSLKGLQRLPALSSSEADLDKVLPANYMSCL